MCKYNAQPDAAINAASVSWVVESVEKPKTVHLYKFTNRKIND
jgi:hypothetical protein